METMIDFPEVFLFRAFTEHGRFHVSTEGESKEQAEQLVVGLFQRLGVKLDRIVLAQRKTGSPDESMILHDGGRRLNAGRKLWHVLGKDAEFDAVVVAERL